MSSIFSATDNDLLIQRINALKPDSPALWGKMNVAQMLAHATMPFKVGSREISSKKNWIGKLFSPINKVFFLNNKPFQHHLPTPPNFVMADEHNFLQEQAKLIELIRKVEIGGPSQLSTDPHPFFGKMNVEQWDLLLTKHTNHHLQQFGV